MIASPSITYLRKLLPSYILSFFAAAISFSLLGGSESFLSLNYMAALLLFSISVSYLELSFHFRRFIQSILYTPLVVNFVVLTEYYEPRFLSVALVLISLPALFRLWGVLPQSILIVSSLFFLPTGANLVSLSLFAAQTLWIAREEDSHQSAKVPEVAQEHYSTFLSASFIAWSTLSLWLFIAAGEIPVNTVLSLLATVVCALSVKHFRPKEVFYFLVILSLLQVNALITEIPAGEGEVFLIMLVLSIGPLAFIYKSPITYSLLLASVFLIAQSLDALFLLTLLLLSVLNSLYYHYFVERHSSAWKRMKEVDSDSVFEVVSNQENNIFEGISRSIFLNNIQITCAVVVAVSLSALVLLVTPEGFSGLGRNFLLKSASVVMLAIAFANYFLVLRPVNSKNYVLFSLSLLVLTCFFISTYVPVLVLINLVLVLFVLLPLKESIVLLMFCAVSSYQALLALELVQLLPSMLLLYSVFFGINRVLYYYLNLTWTFEELISRVSKTSDQKSFRFNMLELYDPF